MAETECGHPSERVIQLWRWRQGKKVKNGTLCKDCWNSVRQARRAFERDIAKEAEAKCRM